MKKAVVSQLRRRQREHERNITCPPRATTDDTKTGLVTRPSLYGNEENHVSTT